MTTLHVLINLQQHSLTQFMQSNQVNKPISSIFYQADVINYHGSSFIPELFQLMGYPNVNPVPLAAVMALAEGLPGFDDYWLRCDPVYLQADVNGLYLLPQDLHLAKLAAQNFVTVANQQLLADDGLSLHAPQPQHWYLQAKELPAINTYPLLEVVGKDISSYLLTGTDAKKWRRLQTELQMLLHHQAINPSLANGIWLWGEGERLAAAPVDKRWAKVLGNELLVKGLAEWAHIPYQAITQFNFDDLLVGQPNLLVISADAESPQPYKTLIENYLMPIYQALKLRQLDRVMLNLAGWEFLLTPRSFKRWWRSLTRRHLFKGAQHEH